MNTDQYKDNNQQVTISSGDRFTFPFIGSGQLKKLGTIRVSGPGPDKSGGAVNAIFLMTGWSYRVHRTENHTVANRVEREIRFYFEGNLRFAVIEHYWISIEPDHYFNGEVKIID